LAHEHGVNAQSCSTIADIACKTDGFSTLCAAVQAAGLGEALTTGTFTVFAPTDDAFAALPAGTVEGLLDDIDALTNILLFHAVADKKVKSCNLRCNGMVEMANGGMSETVCKDGSKFQTGAGNSDDKMPKIATADIMACNGVVHVVNQVLLP
jgi:uncharacterized surface protein with fasciclin (FAS1) repeats